MAGLWCTGPAHLFIGLGLGNFANPAVYTPYYVGTDEDSPTIEIAPKYQEVKNDIGGDDAMDDSYQGRSATIDYNLNRWNEGAIAALEQTNPFSTTLRGTDNPGDVGSLMQTEGLTFPVWVVFPYAASAPTPFLGKPAMAGMPAGYHFLACILTSDNHTRLGTKPRRLRFSFRARRVYTPASGVQSTGLTANQQQFLGVSAPFVRAPGVTATPSNLGSMCLYDHNLTGLPLPN